MSTTGATIIQVAGEIIELAKKNGWIDNLRDFLSKRRTILILGLSGCGKTTFLESLQKDMPKLISHLTRTSVAEKYKFNFPDARINFIDTPGQEHHSSRREKAIRKALKETHLGVINVVSYGYHENRTGKKDAFGANGDVSAPYLNKHRALEIAALREWRSLLGDSASIDWFMTVVNKADLWWNIELDVTKYYEGGKYYSSLGDLRQVNPIVLPYSAILHRFYGEGTLSGNFDTELRNVLRADMLRTIVTLSNGKHS